MIRLALAIGVLTVFGFVAIFLVSEVRGHYKRKEEKENEGTKQTQTNNEN